MWGKMEPLICLRHFWGGSVAHRLKLWDRRIYIFFVSPPSTIFIVYTKLWKYDTKASYTNQKFWGHPVQSETKVQLREYLGPSSPGGQLSRWVRAFRERHRPAFVHLYRSYSPGRQWPGKLPLTSSRNSHKRIPKGQATGLLAFSPTWGAPAGQGRGLQTWTAFALWVSFSEGRLVLGSLPPTTLLTEAPKRTCMEHIAAHMAWVAPSHSLTQRLK